MDRFGKVFKDPRFQRPKKKQTRVKIDDRFKDMLESEEFEFKGVDLYGRTNVPTQKKVDLKKYYKLSDEEQEAEVNLSAWARGKIEEQTSEVEEEFERSENEEADELEIIKLNETNNAQFEEIQETEEILDTLDVEKGDPTSRFAIVNMDWDNVTALDLMKVLEGFKPDTGYIKNVKIYLSEYGKEMLAKEETSGPPTEIFKQAAEEDEEEKLIQEDEAEDFEQEALRRYQLGRLRYYYAVVECDSVATAYKIYKECDGTEYETSSVTIDIRFIPDEMVFEEEPKDECTKLTESYKPRKFITPVLQYSKPKLTWDETDTSRIELLHKTKFSKDELDNMDFSAYLASDNSDSEHDEQDVEKYRKLLLEGAVNSEDEEEGQEMNVTFSSGLSNVAEDLLEKKKRKEQELDETDFDKQLRKKKEKKQKRKDEPEADGEDPFFVSAEPTQKSKKKQDSTSVAADEAELSLLMMDENDDGRKHFDYDEIVKKEKKRGKKSRKNKDNVEEADNFEVDTADPRFEALYTSSHFAVDPNSSKFKKTKAMEKILKERQKRRQAETEDQEKKIGDKAKKVSQDDWKHLVNKIKNKD